MQECLVSYHGGLHGLLSNPNILSSKAANQILNTHHTIFTNLIELLIGFNDLLNSGEIQSRVV